MSSFRIASLGLLTALTLSITACGQKGPLTLPPPATAASAAAAASGPSR